MIRTVLPLDVPGDLILADFHYSHEQWQAFLLSEANKLRKELRLGTLMLICPPLVFLLQINIAALMTSLLAVLFVLVVVDCPAALLMAILVRWASNKIRSAYQELQQLSPEIAVTNRYIYFGGSNHNQTQHAVWLAKAGLLYVSRPANRPDYLRIQLHEQGSRGARDTYEIPIPPGYEGQAEAVVDYFSWRNRALREKRAHMR